MPDDSLLGQLAEEFTRRVREGKLPDIEEYASRYPALAGRIRELFPTLMLLEGMAATSDSVTADALPSGLSPSSVFGQYRIEREIGRGGMGIVYEATHLLLDKRVALKVLPVRTPVDAGHLERFFREARTAAGLHHTNIVPVFDVGQVAGTPYYAMQYIEGRSLDQILRLMQSAGEGAPADGSASDHPGRLRAGVPIRSTDYFRWVADIGIQAAEGLAYAHERKVVHRDIKPSNLLLDTEGVLWIADFGLAKRIEDPAMTQSGTLIGTPRYMSPEQAEAAKRPVDQRSDIYSLGATLYELLTSRPVFEGKTPQEVLTQIVTREPIAPRRLNPEIPVDLSTIVTKAMFKRPQDRYSSARVLAEDLVAWKKLEPIKARPIGPAGRTIRWCRRNPRLAAVTAAAAMIILALSGFYYRSLIRENADTRAALGREQEARRETAAALLQAETSRTQAEDSRKTAVKERDAAQAARDQAQVALGLAKRQSYAANLAAADLYLRENHNTEARQRLDLCNPSLRGWEWRHLFMRLNSSLASLYCSTGNPVAAFRDVPYLLSSFGFTSDRKRFSWNTQYTLHVWDLDTYRPVAVYGYFSPILAVSRDGTRVLADYPRDKTMQVIDPASGKSIASLPSTGERIECAAFNADATRIVTGAESGAVDLWDATSGKALARMEGAKDRVRCVVFSPDGARVGAGVANKTVRLYDVLSGKTLRVIAATESVVSLAFSPDGGRLAAGTWDGRIAVWEAASGKPPVQMDGHRGPVLSIAFSPDGLRIASAGADSTVRIWNANSGAEGAVLLGHPYPWRVHSVAFTPDGTRILSGDQFGGVLVWDAALGQTARTVLGHSGMVTSAVFSPNGSMIAAAQGKTVHLWDADSRKEMRTIAGHKEAVNSLAFSPDGRHLVCGSDDNTVGVWDIQSGKAVTTMRGHGERVWSVAFSPDGRRVLTGSWDKTARVFDATTGNGILTIALADPVMAVAFSPDGTRILTGSARGPGQKGNTVQLWSAATGARVADFNCPDVDKVVGMATAIGGMATASVIAVAFSPDGRRIAAAYSIVPYVGVWDIQSGVPLATLKGHSITVTSVCFSPDGKRILSGSLDGTAILWDAFSYEPVLTLQDVGRHWAFSPNGTRILAARDNGVLILDSRSSYHPEVANLVSTLFKKLTFTDDVLRAIQSDTQLDPELRAAALRDAQTRGEQHPELNSDAWAIVKTPGAGAASYQRALRMAETATRLMPRNATYMNTLAAAQYRVGAYKDAIATLALCTNLRAAPAPADLAFTAMAQFKLGEGDNARAALDQLRALMKERTGPSNKELQNLLHEAEALIGRR